MKSGDNFATERRKVQPVHIPLRLSTADGVAPRSSVEIKRAGGAFFMPGIQGGPL